MSTGYPSPPMRGRRILFLKLGVGLGAVALIWLSLRKPMICFMLVAVLVTMLLAVMIFFKEDGKLSLNRAAASLLVMAILFPFIRLPAGIPSIRPEFIVTLIAWGLLFLGSLAGRYPIRLRRLPTYKWFGLFGFSIILSTAYAAWFKGQPLIGRDFWEIVKVFLYLSIFALVANLNITPKRLREYYKFALFTLLFSAFFSFLQYIDFASINEVVSPYYAPTQMEGLLVYGRVTGTMPNPNEFGALMVLASSFALSGGLFLQERRLRVLCWGALPIFWLALVLTLSRTALVSLFFAVATILFLFFKQKNLKHRLRWGLTFLILVCIVGAFILQLMPAQAIYRYGQLANPTEAATWQERVVKWRVNFAIWKKSPWLGWGPGKATMTTVVDNEWLLLLRRYGLVGIIIFVLWFGSFYLGLTRIRRCASSVPETIALATALQATLVAYAIYMITAAVYHSLQLMPVLLIFLGLVYSQWRPKRTV